MINHSLKSFPFVFLLLLFVLEVRCEIIYASYIYTHVDVRQGMLEYPGTKWCGPGNSAKNHDDLGEDRDTDLCCRDHDDCPEYIEGGHSRHGLTNNAIYTRLACSCDQKFHKCLKDTLAKNSTSISYKVGHVYFDLLGTHCYAEDHPIIICEEYYRNNTKRCRHYKLDETRAPIWQWFDEPLFVEG